MSSSKIDLTDMVENKERKFGSALYYLPVKVNDKDGYTQWAMFTESEVEKAIARANKNKEDIPKSLWKSIFG